ncbi:hypothetical protein DPMN_145764 [Dreissena polymorpha]|uniref:Uncharacterized protein n=1 Tax=Dreissena polymorpha TaxID=45954 RepID=A0A9D4J1I1_DREPO|nr:hypothetical protein DPMN_145764 [Dreissena polymorpha]
MPGRCRLSPVHYQGLTGIKRSQSGLTGILPGYLPASTWAASGNNVTALKMYTLRIIPVLAGRPALANRDGPGLYRQK